ncbi:MULTISPECIES: FtsX-like permease family protein [unclassified Streptomyces]|uniref:ABC transporter permease n=1 Tax=unclassified Streptomyces TaxID=2593676 RepID=UPI000FFF002D|nr:MULTISPECIES: FtsX-like permease family protein [unclassified Streptomyces]
MSALLRVVGAGTARRRVQALVIGLATLIAVTASVLGGSLLVASRAPFDKAFARQHGAHLSAQFDAGRATSAQVAASARAAGVGAASGPFPTASPVMGFGGQAVASLSVVGRATPGGAVDRVDLTEGRWVRKAGEIVVSADTGPAVPLGRQLSFPDLPGSPSLTVVGVARSVSRTADGWVLPSEIPALSASGRAEGYQMLYRFTHAATSTEMSRDRAAVESAVPGSSLTGAQSWLSVRKVATRSTSLFVPFLVAFGVLGLVMSVLIVGNVVAGAVATGRRRIGVLKAVGCTPGQVVRACAAQALLPAALGAVLGTVAGQLLAVPLLSDTEDAYGTAGLGVELWLDAAVAGGVLAVVAVTACTAAWRAGRLRTVDALAVGRTPAPGRGRRAARLAARLPLPRPVGLGLARPFARPARTASMGVDAETATDTARRAGRLRTVDALAVGRTPAPGRGRRAAGLAARLPLPRPVGLGLARPFARPARTASMVAAVVFGAAAVTFATGLSGSLGEVIAAKNHNAADVTVGEAVPGPGGPHTRPGGGRQTPADPAAITKAIEDTDGTRRYYGTATAQAALAGVSGEISLVAYDGDASWGGFRMVSGRWVHKPGEVVVASSVLTLAGAKVGDTITLRVHGKPVPVRIVGEVFDTGDDGTRVFTDAATLRSALPDLKPTTYAIDLTAGTDKDAYVKALDSALQPLGTSATGEKYVNGSDSVTVIDALTAFLTALLICVAALGVLGGVVLDTHERIRDLGIHKALGMTPRQTVTLVITSVLLPGIVGGALGVPLGVAVHDAVVPAMGHSGGLRLPESVLAVYGTPELVLLALSGAAVAVLGSLLPAGWAARIRTATALRAE